MSDPQKTVFISYRRNVASFTARAIFQDLRTHGYDVFMDVESIDSGTFDTIILNQIAARAHFLVILTPGTLERCEEPKDWLRREIERAIELQRNIIPVLVNNFQFADAQKYLTKGLVVLQRYNAINLPHDYFDAAMEKLRTRFLKQPLEGKIVITPPNEQVIVRQRIADITQLPHTTGNQLNAEVYYIRGNSGYDSGDYALAVSNYTKAIQLNPQYADAYNNRGISREAQGDLKGAIEDYTHAISISYQLPEAFNNRGNVYYDLTEYEKAIADYTAAIRLNPVYSKAYSNRGFTHLALQDYPNAIADYSQAIHLSPQTVRPYLVRGAIYIELEDYPKAYSDFSEAIRFDSTCEEAYQLRSICLYLQGQYIHAISDLNELIKINPNDASFHNDRAEIYFLLKKYDDALFDFQKSIALQPTLSAFAGLAITYHAQGKIRGALGIWKTDLIAINRNYYNPDWVGKELGWAEPLIEEARKLIAGL